MNDESIREAITVVTNAVNYMSGDANEKDYRVLIELAQQYLDAGEMVEEKNKEDMNINPNYRDGFNAARSQCLLLLVKKEMELDYEQDKRMELQEKLDQMSKSASVEKIYDHTEKCPDERE